MGAIMQCCPFNPLNKPKKYRIRPKIMAHKYMWIMLEGTSQILLVVQDPVRTNLTKRGFWSSPSCPSVQGFFYTLTIYNKHSENGIELWRSGTESPFIVVYRLKPPIDFKI